MPSSKTTYFSFLLIVIVNLSAEYFDYALLIYVSKPLLLSTLAYAYHQATKPDQQPFDRTIILALLLSCLGDVLLLFVEQQAQGMLFFAAGLGSFLLAHIAYIYSFWLFPPAKQLHFSALVVLCFMSLAATLLFFLWSGIPTALKLPVSVYAVTICIMGIAAFGTQKKVGKTAFYFLIFGAICFILSDSLIAINKFKTTVVVWQPRIAIMLTYILAQWLIVNGMIKARNHLIASGLISKQI